MASQLDSALLGNTFFDLVMENNPNMIFVKDENFIIRYANKAFFNLYPLEHRDRIIGYTTIEDFSEEQAALFLAEDRKAFKEGYTEIIEELSNHQGVMRTYLTKKIRFQGGDGKPLMLGICTDITELAEREKALVQANTMLENFAALAAHDLRSPLASYVSMLELIELDKSNKITPDGRFMLSSMRDSIEMLLQHIAGLMKVYKADFEGSLERSEVDLNLVLEQVKFNLHILIEQQGKIHSNRLPVLQVDAHLFRHLFHNLIENAVKYRGSEPPVIIIKHQLNNNEHCFSVEDNGMGLGEVSDEALFRVFQQGGGTKAGGVGIGMALCKKVVELHGGKIWTDRTVEKGSRICFTIPADVQL